MLTKKQFRDLISSSEYPQRDKIFFALLFRDNQPLSINEIRSLLEVNGLKKVRQWNINTILDRAEGLVIETVEGWELTTNGLEYIYGTSKKNTEESSRKINDSLRILLPQIKNQNTSKFVEEAIQSYEYKLYRSAVVLSWVGAIAVLYDYVLSNRLSDFNIESIKRDSKRKPVKNMDDLAKISEHEFLEILESISVFGKSVKQELQARLKMRNGCGHPNSFHLSDNMVAAHIESLIVNVFTQFM